jgi:hypothetical protein
LRYAELNPVRASMVIRASDWPWSSAAVHCGATPVAPWLDMELWGRSVGPILVIRGNFVCHETLDVDAPVHNFTALQFGMLAYCFGLKDEAAFPDNLIVELQPAQNWVKPI